LKLLASANISSARGLYSLSRYHMLCNHGEEFQHFDGLVAINGPT